MTTISHSNFLKLLECFTILPDWVDQPFVHEFTQKLYLFTDKNNVKRHYEFLRYIMFDLCNHINDKKYFDFLHLVLFTLFEENGISLDHKVNENEKLYSILTLPEIINIFDESGEIRISNSRILILMDLLQKNPNICEAIKKEINSTSYSNRSSNNGKTKRFHPYSRKGGKKKKRTIKKNQKRKKI